MPHKSGKKSYPAKKGHPGKKMPMKGKGMMMSDKEMKAHKKKMMG